MLRSDEIRLGLVNVAHGVADIRRLDDGKRVALFYGRPERRENLEHSSCDGRKHVSGPLIVERHCPGGQNGVVDGLLGDRDDFDLGVCDLRCSQPDLTGRRFGARGVDDRGGLAARGCEQQAREGGKRARIHGFAQSFCESAAAPLMTTC